MTTESLTNSESTTRPRNLEPATCESQSSAPARSPAQAEPLSQPVSMQASDSSWRWARTRIWLAGAGFTAFGAFFTWLRVTDLAVSAPLLLFYAVLIVNTVFSVRHFDRVVPRDHLQTVIDYTLIALYILLSAQLHNPKAFTLVATLLFGTATMKYVLLIGRVEWTKLLHRKIRVDIIATLACALALAGVLAGHATIATWTLATITLVGNIYLLVIRPLYRIEPS